jgi:hypothetical protein
MEIFFDDFKPGVQEEILKMFNINDPKEMNWDTIPILILETEIDETN